MSNHTPGPWKTFVNLDDRRVIAGESGYSICDIGQVKFEDEFAEKDAALIAAAPEMLKLLERYATDSFCYECGAPQYGEYAGCTEDCKLAAVLKKARPTT